MESISEEQWKIDSFRRRGVSSLSQTLVAMCSMKPSFLDSPKYICYTLSWRTNRDCKSFRPQRDEWLVNCHVIYINNFLFCLIIKGLSRCCSDVASLPMWVRRGNHTGDIQMKLWHLGINSVVETKFIIEFLSEYQNISPMSLHDEVTSGSCRKWYRHITAKPARPPSCLW